MQNSTHNDGIFDGCSTPWPRNMGCALRAWGSSPSDGFVSLVAKGGITVSVISTVNAYREDGIMAEGMKSARELALERTDHVRKAIQEEGLTLTEAQREQLAELEREDNAKIAEKDVMLQTEIRQIFMRYPPAEAYAQAEKLRQRFLDEKRKLTEEKEEKVARIRQAGK